MRQFAIIPRGRIGNQMIQYLVAKRLEQMVGNLEIVGVQMPEWGLEVPVPAGSAVDEYPELRGSLFDLRQVARWLRGGLVAGVRFAGYGQRLAHLPSCEESRRVFASRPDPSAGAGADDLLINIRAEDILSEVIHPDYGLLPIRFYREIVAATGLRPIFQGQLEAGPYMEKIRAAFPDARYWPSRGPMADFQLIRNSQNVVLSISTFTWLAAWLSNARRIFLPICGLFNPEQRPDIHLLPLDDERYVFYKFPLRNWAAAWSRATPLYDDSLAFREMNRAEVRDLVAGTNRRTAAKLMAKRLQFAYECIRHSKIAHAIRRPRGSRGAP